MDYFLFYIMRYGIYIILAFLIWRIIRAFIYKGIQIYHSNWNHLIEPFEFSTDEFYRKFRKELMSHGISGIMAQDITLREGNIFSSRRRYIQVDWKEYQYNICAAPFGDGFFVSWWLLKRLSWVQIILSLLIGTWLARKLFPVTFYRMDTASMLMKYAQKSVLKVIEEITNDSGVRAMTEDERKPLLNTGDIFKR